MRQRLATLACAIVVLLAPALAPRQAAAQDTAAVAMAPDTSWVHRSAIYEVNVRDFSPAGTLRGVTDGLDRIAATGADVIWLMPIYPVGVVNRKGPLGSPYAVRDYHAIDSAFGTGADLHALVSAAHARHMKVILDWVPDHSSWDNVWVNEHPGFYVRNDSGELSVPRDPSGHLTDWTDVAQLDFKNPALRNAMIDVMRYWLTTYDLDGFRVDAAGFVPDDFWRQANAALRAAVSRPIMLLAEWGNLRMHRLGFDLTYAWDSYGRLKGVWGGGPADTYVRTEMADLRNMPAGGMRLRFTTNHDETAWDKPPVALFGGSAGARAAFVAMALLPGRPMLYDGQEVESPQRLGLFVRDAIVWDQPDAAAARAFYARVMRLARTEPAFLSPDLAEVETSAPDDVIAYRRQDVIVLVNVRSHAVQAGVSGVVLNGARDLLSNVTQRGDTVALPAFGAVVLKLAGPS
jgi:1,4-alpha-glucan branching enzyme